MRSRLGAALATLLIVACTNATPSAQTILDRTAQDAAALKTVHFDLVRQGQSVLLDSTTGLSFTEATGDYVSPDRVRAKIKAQRGSLVLGLEMIWISGVVYGSNPLTGTFAALPVLPALDATSLFGSDGVPGIVGTGLRELRLVGTESLDGVSTYHLTGTADGERLRVLTAGAVVSGARGVDLWVEVATSHLKRLIAHDPDGSAWQLDLSEFDRSVEISAP